MIIDGNSVVNRAFYALPPLTNSEGLYTNAIYGFMNMLLKLREQHSPDYLLVTFDVSRKTFRNEIYEDYKGTRKGMPEELRMQMPVLKDLLDELAIARLEVKGYEADDLIGTMTRLASESGVKSMIVTGDKDNLQLVDNMVTVALTKRGVTDLKMFSPDDVKEELGIGPELVIDYKALAGDSSDNIPGVAGVGPKTAVKLLTAYGSLEGVYENVESIKSVRTQTLLTESKNLAFISQKLAKIKRDVPVQADFNSYEDILSVSDEAIEFLKELELDSVIKSLGVKSEAKREMPKPGSIKELSDAKSIDINKPFGVHTISYDDRLIIGILQGEMFYTDNPEMIIKLKSLLENGNGISGFDLKSDMLSLDGHNIRLSGIADDVMLMHYLVYPDRNSSDPEKVARHVLGLEFDSLDDISKKGKLSFNEVRENLISYLEMVLVLIRDSRQTLRDEMVRLDLTELYEGIELPLVKVLFEMEKEGFRIDMDFLKDFDVKISKRLEELETGITDLAGEAFNLNSPKQLGYILFDKLGLPVIKKTKTGYSTDKEVLDKLSGSHEIVGNIVEYRQLIKLKGTYIDGLSKLIRDDGKLHTSFNQTVAVTGRLSSTEPNLQNIPIRLSEGREIRKMFIPSADDRVLVDADYSQVELRILAHMSGDEMMLKAFRENLDVHTLTASQVFDTVPALVTDKQRRDAKAVNFGIVYGISDYGLSENLGISRKEAKDYIEKYFAKYGKVKEYLDSVIEKCKNDGYVKTYFGRIREIPDINSRNFNKRSFAERTAMNTPIQGTAADVIKKAMIDVQNELLSRKMKSKLILQVHDELIIDADPSEVEEVKEILRRNMEGAADFAVPLEIDMKVGGSWYETK